MREIFGVMELFNILFVVVVIQVCASDKIPELYSKKSECYYM